MFEQKTRNREGTNPDLCIDFTVNCNDRVILQGGSRYDDQRVFKALRL